MLIAYRETFLGPITLSEHRFYWCNREKAAGRWIEIHNEAFHNFYSSH
jgi:hypothetical protein